MKIRLAKLVDISNISTLYRTLFQTMAELQIEYYRKADQDVDFLKSVINSDLSCYCYRHCYTTYL